MTTLTEDAKLELREREMVRLVRASRGRTTGYEFDVIAQRDHNHLSVIVVKYNDDNQIWVAWTDGPRSDAEVQPSLAAALAAFADGITCDLESGYFE